MLEEWFTIYETKISQQILHVSFLFWYSFISYECSTYLISEFELLEMLLIKRSFHSDVGKYPNERLLYISAYYVEQEGKKAVNKARY